MISMKKSRILFNKVVDALCTIHVRAPKTEKELHVIVRNRLIKYGFEIQDEKGTKVGRPDMRSLNVVVEVKKVATTGCVRQLDRYSTISNGLVIVCVRATQPFRQVFNKADVKIPCALIELRTQAPMVS